jgi:protein phosphatase
MIAEKDFAGRQSRGVRELQEDSYAFWEMTGASGRPEGLLVVVADGMGGHNAGERASELAVNSFVAEFRRKTGAIAKRLKGALNAANDAIALELEREASYEGMGTTLLAVSVTPAGVEWLSVGDSPLYLCREGALTRLNEDHSLRPVLREMAARGDAAGADMAMHPSRNILRAALMGDEIELIDQSKKPVVLQKGDIVLAASDGIHTLNDREIAMQCKMAESKDAELLAGHILRAIMEAGNPKQDNTTVVIIKPVSAADEMPL